MPSETLLLMDRKPVANPSDGMIQLMKDLCRATAMTHMLVQNPVNISRGTLFWMVYGRGAPTSTRLARRDQPAPVRYMVFKFRYPTRRSIMDARDVRKLMDVALLEKMLGKYGPLDLPE